MQTLAQAALSLQSGRETAQDLVETALARAQDPAGEGTRVYTEIHADQARAAAQASDLLRARGLARSPLEGLPISVKDLFDIQGRTTRAGSVVLVDAPPATRSARVVERLQAAGAIVIGRTNMTEFAYSGLGINPHYGTPLNPWDRATGRIPGGSSAGAAVSVTDGMALAGIGSDTGGSVRIPAALCGLTGFKPTARRVPMEGVLPLSAHLDSLGPIAPSVACCALLDAVMAGESWDDLPQALPLAGLRLAMPTTKVLDDMDETVARVFERACATLRQAGAQVTEIALSELADVADINAKGGFTAAEAWAWHRGLIAQAEDRYDPRVVSRIRRGSEQSAADFIDLLAARRQWIARVTARIAAYDALLMPTVPTVAPPLADLARDDATYFHFNGLMLRNATFINFLDGCAVSLPAHAPGEAPVGLSVAMTAGQDRRLLGVAYAVEAVLRPVAGA